MLITSEYYNHLLMRKEFHYLWRNPVTGKTEEVFSNSVNIPYPKDYAITDFKITPIGPVGIRFRWWVLVAKVRVWWRNIFNPWSHA